VATIVGNPRASAQAADDPGPLLNLTSFAAISGPPLTLPLGRRLVDDRHDVFLARDDQLFARDFDLGAAIFSEEHPITHFEVHRADRPVLKDLALADGDHAALGRLLAGRIRNQDAPG
jgi:hypothetical protein